MKSTLKWLSLVGVMALYTMATFAATKYVITNDDTFTGNSATIYSIGKNGMLTLVTSIATGGSGMGGGDFASGRVSVLRSKTQNCAYIGDAWGMNSTRPGAVAAINMDTLTLVRRFLGFPLDSGAFVGVGLAESRHGKYLFAAFTESSTLATYKQLAGCKLKRVSEITAIGASRGAIDGMKVTPDSKTVVVGYEDGSVGSYHINPNTGALNLISMELIPDGANAAGVDITSDGKWALFGAVSSGSEVEVAAIKPDGSLGTIIGYMGVGTGSNSNNVWLSPDETLLYISNNVSGQISAAPFNKKTGVIDTAHSCTSAKLSGWHSTWKYLGAVVGGPTGTGSPLYTAEFGPNQPSGIAIVNVKRPCSLIEATGSPVSDPNSTGLLTIGEDPPRPF